MARIYMVRHGKAAAGWGDDPDPGLDETGEAQARAAAGELQAQLGARHLPILTSPLRRCRETAIPLARAWDREPVINPDVAEIPSPIEDLAARAEWLRGVMAGTWADLAVKPGAHTGYRIDFLAWRQRVIDALLACSEDTVIFSHFIAINVAAGHALEDNRVVCFRPDNCSITVFETRGGELILREKGREADTKVN